MRVPAARLVLLLAFLSGLGVPACGGASGGPIAPASASVASSRRSSPSPQTTPAPPEAAAADDADIDKAVQTYLDLLTDIHPEEASALGLHANDALLDDRTIAGHDRGTAREQAMLESIESRFANPRASAAARSDLAMLAGALRCDVRKKRVQRPLQRQPDVYLQPLGAIFQLVARPYAPAPERARNVLARLAKIPATVDLAKQNLLNPPRVWTEIAIEKAAGAKAFLDQQRSFLVSALPDESARIDGALKAAVTSYDEYRQFLQRQILPRSNGRFAAGKELFELLLANDHFLEEDADKLLALGSAAFTETAAKMTELAARIDPKAKGWPDVTARLKAKHPAAEELLASYRKEVVRARAFLVAKDAVAFPAGDDLEVIDTPTFLRTTLSAAYDRPPPFDDRSTKGFFFVTPIDLSLPKAKQEQMLRENDWADIVDTTVHEAYPGHHLQLSFARLVPSRARRAFDHAISSEGWALYAEELMAELGYYDDEQRLIQLEWTLVRAARIIIDVGLHVGTMTFEQAVKMLTDDVHLERPLATSEVRRYTEEPTQPSAYLAGRQKLLELRERVRKRDGAGFSLKAFHTDVLTRGTVPPGLLAREMFPAR